MAPISIRPTGFDKNVAEVVARYTGPRIERGAQALTWGADEYLLIAAAAMGWFLTRKSEDPIRRLSTHILACALSVIYPAAYPQNLHRSGTS